MDTLSEMVEEIGDRIAKAIDDDILSRCAECAECYPTDCPLFKRCIVQTRCAAWSNPPEIRLEYRLHKPEPCSTTIRQGWRPIG